MSFESEINNSENMQQQFDIESFLIFAVGQGISDIHLRVNAPPMARKDGKIVKSKLPSLTHEDMNKIIDKITPDEIKSKIESTFDIDFSAEVPNLARFRINMLRDLGNIGFVIRVVPYQVPSIDSLYLPPVLKDLTKLNNGLVLVTGPTGSGKSTTLASMLDYLNENEQKHVITLEDPIEFMHTNKKSMFTQRQLGIDIDSFPNGVKYALRQDPDIVLIGEMRDRETITNALKAAETGHLVFSTLHTTDAVKTIYRIINSFEPHEREAVRLQIAATLQGTVTQKLVERADGTGRVPATEVLVGTPTVKNYILKNEIDNIYELMKTDNYSGMMTMNMSLFKLVNAGLVTKEAAIQASDTPNEMEQMLKGAFHGTMNIKF